MAKVDYELKDDAVLICKDASMTQQQFTAEVDINTIVRRAIAGQEVTHLNSRPGQYGDFSSIPDYRESFEVVKRANALFMDMPWEVRERFANDPQRMVQFLQDPKNRDEAIKLGLVKAPVVEPVISSSGKNGDEPKADTK